MHHRLAEPLEMQLAEFRELVEEMDEDLVVHEGGRAVGRAVGAELECAHLATQIALPDRFNLQFGRQPPASLARAEWRTAHTSLFDIAHLPDTVRPSQSHGGDTPVWP